MQAMKRTVETHKYSSWTFVVYPQGDGSNNKKTNSAPATLHEVSETQHLFPAACAGPLHFQWHEACTGNLQDARNSSYREWTKAHAQGKSEL